MGLALRRHARRGRGKAKADDQRHAGERQHHHLKVRKAVVGKQRKIVHYMPDGRARDETVSHWID